MSAETNGNARIVVEGVGKWFGALQVFRDINISFGEREIVAALPGGDCPDEAGDGFSALVVWGTGQDGVPVLVPGFEPGLVCVLPGGDELRPGWLCRTHGPIDRLQEAHGDANGATIAAADFRSGLLVRLDLVPVRQSNLEHLAQEVRNLLPEHLLIRGHESRVQILIAETDQRRIDCFHQPARFRLTLKLREYLADRPEQDIAGN